MSPSPVTCSEGCFCAAFACPACAPHLQLPGAPRCLGEPPCAKSGAFAARAIPLERAVARGCREAGARVAMHCTSIARLADMNRDVPVHDTRHIEIVCNVWPATLAWTPAYTSYSTSTVVVAPKLPGHMKLPTASACCACIRCKCSCPPPAAWVLRRSGIIVIAVAAQRALAASMLHLPLPTAAVVGVRARFERAFG